MNLNICHIAGTLTRDPETQKTAKGTSFSKFGIAINRTWKDENGNKKEEATFIDVEAWGKTAEFIADYFKKGSNIFIEGRLKLDTWEDRQSGQKRSKLGVVVEKAHFAGGKPSGQRDDRQERPAAKRQPSKDFDPDDEPPF